MSKKRMIIKQRKKKTGTCNK